MQMAEKTPNIPQKSGVGNIWVKEYISVWRPTWNLSNTYLKTDHMFYLIDLVCGTGSKSTFPNPLLHFLGAERSSSAELWRDY